MSISFKLYVDILRKGHIALSNSRPHVVVSVLGRCTWINFTGSIVFAQLFAQGVDMVLDDISHHMEVSYRRGVKVLDHKSCQTSLFHV